MSRGPGAVETRIAALFSEVNDRGVGVGELADHAFALAGKAATRAQRLSATRAGHRLLRREAFAFWKSTVFRHRLIFHPKDVPLAIWAVEVRPAGVIWIDAPIISIGEHIAVNYHARRIRLDRYRLSRGWWVIWRNVAFVADRDGIRDDRAAQSLNEAWRKRYGAGPGEVSGEGGR